MSCVTCGVPFPASDAKAHYGTAFHTANLKRRVADLPPLTAAAFARMQQVESERAAAALAADEMVLYICDACGKRFGSEGQFTNHNGSKRHRERVRELIAERRAAAAAAAAPPPPQAAAGSVGGAGGSGAAAAAAAPGEAMGGGEEAAEGGEGGEGGEEEEGEELGEGMEITSTHCPFCWAASDSVEANLLHMRAIHSFCLPDAPYCVDAAGLIERLHELVIDERRCVLRCSAKQFECPEDAQRHMADKVHCRIRYEEAEDFEAWEAFYDYADAPEPAAEDVGTVNGDGNLVLAGGRVAYTGAIAKYFKQRVALPDERDSVRTVLHHLALEHWGEGAEAAGYGAPGAAGGGGGGGGGRAAVPLARLQAAAAQRTGTRGNLTNAVAQQRAQKRASHFGLLVGMNQNQIRRRWFRVATTLTGVRDFARARARSLAFSPRLSRTLHTPHVSCSPPRSQRTG
jgi:hypothetical protein